jgi:phosphoserine phosphatase RsbU/P
VQRPTIYFAKGAIPDMADLTVVAGSGIGRKFQLDRVLCIGRGMDMDIRLDDLTASKQHARITRNTQGGHILEDLGSSNGTFVNEVQMGTTHILSDGDQIRIGSHVLMFAASSLPHGVNDADMTLLDIHREESATSVISAVEMSSTGTFWARDEESNLEDIAAKNARLMTLVDILQAIGSELDEDKLLNRILESLLSIFPDTDRGFIILRELETGNLTVAAQRYRTGAPPQPQQRLQISATILEYVLQEKRAVLSNDAMEDDRFAASESIVEFAMRSVMCAPLMHEGDVLGFTLLDTQRVSRNYNEEGLALLAGLTNQAALTIANAHLHQRLMHRELIERDLKHAQQIQNSFLPTAPPSVEDYAFVDWYDAAQEVGGDFYDFIPLPDGRLVVVVGDVSGKGITAALMMAKMSSNVRFLATTTPEPSALLAKLNEVAMQTESDMFVTVLILVLDPQNHSVTMANAGHCYPVLFASDGSTRIVEVESGFPIGISDEVEYPEATVTLGPGEALCAFTDGIIEAMSLTQAQYGYEKLCPALAAAEGEPDQAIEQIRRSIREHTQDAPQSDDLTVVCFGREPERVLLFDDVSGDAALEDIPIVAPIEGA